MDPQSPMPPLDSAVPQVPASPASTPAEPAPAPQNLKQQVVEKINGAKNVLVTVGTEPTVDELAAALGLTFLLGKLGKHATAVFSGKTPPAIDFLDPDKTFERTVDSLRDFIIALDKEKADKLRYKVEDEVVKVYITPYRTTITEKDLQYSQGDFNVDVVVALGVTKRDELDKAITAHGRILHDAQVITVNANDKKSDLGAVDWVDETASSLSEMLMSISESFGSGLVDEQISTAFLTGIVAETNRFSNEKTSPKVMTMSAQLMAAGANQQLIATNLRQEGMISESIQAQKPSSKDSNTEVVVDHGKKQAKSGNSETPKDKAPKTLPKDEAAAQQRASVETVPKSVPVASPATPEPSPEPSVGAAATLDSVPPAAPPEPTVAPAKAGDAPKVELKPDHSLIPPAPDTAAEAAAALPGDMAQKPDFGGTINATAGEAEAQTVEELAENRTEASNTPGEDDALAEARKAIEEITNEQPFDPANKPLESIGAQELPPVHAPDALSPDGSAGTVQESTAVQNAAAAAVQAQPEPSPMDSFMQPHQQTPQAPNQFTDPNVAPVAPGGDLPPMPPLPPLPGSEAGGMPPLPPVSNPGQSADPTAGFQPQTTPAFMQNVPQSQNAWTEAGQDMAAKQADKDAARQEKLDTMAAQYDAAVDKNRELQGQPPLNNDHSTFPLPPSK